jgi:hypothetical protein
VVVMTAVGEQTDEAPDETHVAVEPQTVPLAVWQALLIGAVEVLVKLQEDEDAPRDLHVALAPQTVPLDV